MTGVVAPGLKFGKLAIRCGSAGAKALVRDPQTRMAAEKFVHSSSSLSLRLITSLCIPGQSRRRSGNRSSFKCQRYLWSQGSTNHKIVETMTTYFIKYPVFWSVVQSNLELVSATKEMKGSHAAEEMRKMANEYDEITTELERALLEPSSDDDFNLNRLFDDSDGITA